MNLGRRFFSATGRRIGGGVERGQCNFCPFLSNAVDGGRVVLLPVLLSFLVVFGGIGSLLRLSDCLLVLGSDECFPMASHFKTCIKVIHIVEHLSTNLSTFPRSCKFYVGCMEMLACWPAVLKPAQSYLYYCLKSYIVKNHLSKLDHALCPEIAIHA